MNPAQLKNVGLFRGWSSDFTPKRGAGNDGGTLRLSINLTADVLRSIEYS
jgi:hypothetical protein